MTGGMGAVGAMGGMGALSGMTPLNGMGSMGGLNGPLDALTPSGFQGNGTSQISNLRMQQITDLLAGLSSAEILLALMITAAASKKCKDDDGSGALALLAGMAMASRMNGGAGLDAGNFNLGAELGISGGSLNVMA